MHAIKIISGYTGSFETWRVRAQTVLPYVATIYYVEIILLLIFINFLYGRPVAVVSGVLCSVLLTVHVLMLFNGSAGCRKVQLLLMDIHFAWSVTFITGLFVSDLPVTGVDLAVMIFRGAAALVELSLVLLIAGYGE